MRSGYLIDQSTSREYPHFSEIRRPDDLYMALRCRPFKSDTLSKKGPTAPPEKAKIGLQDLISIPHNSHSASFKDMERPSNVRPAQVIKPLLPRCRLLEHWMPGNGSLALSNTKYGENRWLWQRFQDDGTVSRCYSTGRPRVRTPNEDRYIWQLPPKETYGAQHKTCLFSSLQLPVRQFQGRP
ncbi:uncharacterized protein TNCV_3059421 [Trichonephila clavipes]|nr:uncharacterized protein TNCV_3059421 [Trichonephila clavipes]